MRVKSFSLDLTKIGGEGDFPCPMCGTRISPDDETENVYTIIESIGDDDYIESLSIRCNKCNSIINLKGFDALSEEASSRIEISEALFGSEPGYRTHHTISFDGQCICKLTVEYANKEDVKAFKRLRNLHIGEPFKSTITIEDTEKTNPDHENFKEITKAVKNKFKGLKDRDIYIVKIKEGRKNFIGRASNL